MIKKVIFQYAFLACLTLLICAIAVPETHGRSRTKQYVQIKIDDEKVPSKAIPWAIWIAFSGAVIWVGFKDAKRSHLD